ncbi:hypothetical protein PoB_004811900 [Plakobranchus ocellatus]|uniref:Uncharacterized protein n=1 Tax=Plakobranchus ocellatus TaxID=259542 RepID=A0AAV4BTC1_9GAST|nr:hypothetical protein PoB_004811900 [Plakobranchus ocellatus]
MPQDAVELNGLLDKTAVTSSDIATHTQKHPALSQNLRLYKISRGRQNLGAGCTLTLRVLTWDSAGWKSASSIKLPLVLFNVRNRDSFVPVKGAAFTSSEFHQFMENNEFEDICK